MAFLTAASISSRMVRLTTSVVTANTVISGFGSWFDKVLRVVTIQDFHVHWTTCLAVYIAGWTLGGMIEKYVVTCI